jgi:aldehyde dehydrogenase (NAD+)
MTEKYRGDHTGSLLRPQTLLAFIERSETEQVSVNLPTFGWDVHHPFGGFRDSGSVFKEQGAPGIRFCTRIKTAAVRFAW